MSTCDSDVRGGSQRGRDAASWKPALRGRARLVTVGLVCALLTLAPGSDGALSAGDGRFIRGDANMDGQVSLADVFALLRYLHMGEVRLDCLDAADCDDSGSIGVADPLFLLGAIFIRGSWVHGLPPTPFPGAGLDPTPDALSCRRGLPGGEGGGGGLEEGATADDPEADDPEADGAGGGGGPCDGDLEGADAEFIHFRSAQDFLVFPGQQGIRAPIYLRTLGQLEGVTISVRSPSPHLRLESIDFSGGELERHASRAAWRHSYDGLRDDGYLAATYVLDLAEGAATLPPTFDASVAHLVFSVRENAPVEEELEIRFESTPGSGLLPPIRNEFVRRGQTVTHDHCGLRLRVEAESDLFLRGDANRDRRVNLTDATSLLLYLFRGGRASVTCEDGADVNDNGRIEITDAIALLRYLFFGDAPPYPPFPYPGTDRADNRDPLGCRGPLPTR